MDVSGPRVDLVSLKILKRLAPDHFRKTNGDGWIVQMIECLERFEKLGAIPLNLSRTFLKPLNQNEHFEVNSAQSQISEVSNMYQEIYQQQREPRKNITLKICHPIAICHLGLQA